jgi:hypothetical protein
MKITSNHPVRRVRRAHTVSRALGWFSIGLGVAELLAPRALSRGTGMRTDNRLVMAYGVREIATGVALLRADNPTPWLWARVAGDVLDVATLGKQGRPTSLKTALAIAAVAGVAVVDLATAQTLQSQQRREQRAKKYDYSDRRGMPLPPQEMRGAALEDFEVPEDMRTPRALAPYGAA